ncbi:MAG: folate-binding protein YgfZ [Pseudomonadales bacterium]|jgi:folate-binding protein YgfZ|nr:folate-binding protein YgfZ [Pseudomonadales bacterium]
MTYRLEQFGFLKVIGKDAISFMQGYTTCDLNALTGSSVQLGAICNLQGRMLTSFLVIREGNDLILRMHRSLVEGTMQFLNKYIVFSKAELQDISDELHCFGSTDVSDSGAEVDRDGDSICINLANRSEIWQPADIKNAVQADVEWQDLEIAAGIAWVNDSTSEQFLPQMFAYHLLGGINFNKGCYLGQEIVARMQYRGELKRRLHRTSRTVSEGDVVASGSTDCLVILNNTTDEPIEVAGNDGSVTAIPIRGD